MSNILANFGKYAISDCPFITLMLNCLFGLSPSVFRMNYVHIVLIVSHRGLNVILTHRGRDKMDAISQTTFSNVFSWMKMHGFRLLKFVPKVRINNVPALVQIMSWRRPGDKPLSEPMMVSLLTHICVTRPQWVKVKCSTGKPVYNDHLVGYFSAFWSSFRWPRAT